MKRTIILLSALAITMIAFGQQEPIKIQFKRVNQATSQYYRFLKAYEMRKACDNFVEIDVNDPDLRFEWFIFRIRVIKKRHYKYIINPKPIGFGLEYQQLIRTKKK